MMPTCLIWRLLRKGVEGEHVEGHKTPQGLGLNFKGTIAVKQIALHSFCMILTWTLASLGAEPKATKVLEPGDDHDWSYDGLHGVGPPLWGKVAPHALGVFQSPIKLPVWNSDRLKARLPVKYGKVGIDLFHNNGHTWKGTYKKDGGTLTLGGREYKLIQFHLHAPSEHSLNPRTAAEKELANSLGATESVVYASGLRSDFHFPMELHLVHRSDDDKLAVIGVFIVPGDDGYPQDGAFMAKCNQFIKERGALWRAHGEKESDPYEIDMASFLPELDAYQWYDGSLTTPPCSESVRWIVVRQPIPFRSEWITMFKESMELAGNPFTSRPPQNLYGRNITAVYAGRQQAPPVGNVAGAFAGTWKGDGGTLVIGEALTVLLHNDEQDHVGFATHVGQDLHVKFVNGDTDEFSLVDDKAEFDDQLHSRRFGELTPFGEVAGFVGEWIDDEFELLSIEEGVKADWTRPNGVTDRYMGEIRGNRLSLRQDDEIVVFRLVDGALTNSRHGRFSK